jgi:hypothetical protein
VTAMKTMTGATTANPTTATEAKEAAMVTVAVAEAFTTMSYDGGGGDSRQ